MFSLLIFGFGAAAGILLAFAGAGFVENSAGIVVTVFLSALLVVGGVGMLLFVLRRPILRRLFGYAETQLELFADPLARVASGAMDRDPGATTLAARDLVALGLARYSWLAARRWVIATLTALIAAMAALAGTALLFKQNALLATQNSLIVLQNDKIQTQTTLLAQQVELAEAQRNAGLVGEMISIAGLVGEAAERSAKSLADGVGSGGSARSAVDGMVNVIDPVTQLDRSLLLRIVSVSRAVKPYRFLDTGLLPDDPSDRFRVAMQARRDDLPQTWGRMADAFGWRSTVGQSALIDRPASPERGQLLQILLSGGIRNLEVLNFFGMDLSFADFQNAEISQVTTVGGRFEYADFSGSAITSSDLGGAVFDNARFRRTVVNDSDFSEATADRLHTPYRASGAPYRSGLVGADFTEALIRTTRFRGADLKASLFDGAVLAGVDFSDASLGAASLRNTVILKARFESADLKSADLAGAIVFGASFLDDLAAAVETGRFRKDQYRADPMTRADVMAVRAVQLALLTEDDVDALTGGLAAFRLTRIAPIEN